MRQSLSIFAVLCILLSSCVGNGSSGNSNDGGVAFAPRERRSSMSHYEREAAISQKRDELALINVKTQLSPHSVRMSILPPALSEDIDEASCEKILYKLLNIASYNGISGVNGSSSIAFAAAMEQTSKTVTGSAPQKMVVKYTVTYYILNTDTGDVYGSCSEDLVGVGDSFQIATGKVIDGISNTDAIQRMISESNTRIVEWYNSNFQSIKNLVDEAMANKEYAYAMSILRNVPEASVEAYSQASMMLPSVIEAFKKQVASDELAALKSAIVGAKAEYDPSVGAHLALLPVGSEEAKEGAVLFEKYMNQVDAERLRKISAEERERLEQIELQKLQMKYESDAATSKALAIASRRRGLGVGRLARSFFTGASLMSMFSNVLSRCLFFL